MDGEAFDRLSVAVHRLRGQATRRGALRMLLGGSVAAASGLLGHDAEAKKKKKNKNKKNNCRGYGGRCKKNGDCCYGKCRNGWCYYNGSGGGGGGNKNCGGRKCPSGWGCCKQNGVSICRPNTFPTCCGNKGWTDGYRCCNSRSGQVCPINQECCGISCCQDGWKCCGNGRCCPDGWRCGKIACEFRQVAVNGEVATDSVQTMPFADPVDPEVSDKDWITLDH
ncbi:MAG: hypothetical protein IT338_19695 [Thermomicrobiales bacterium]|nr:hypothetical protein [Thermomicrobiales bacterium]